MRELIYMMLILMGGLLVGCGDDDSSDMEPEEPEDEPTERVYEIVWSDEFEGEGAIDTDKWHHQTILPEGGSWFNGEVQHYTNREDNSYQQDGFLHIVAKKESFTDQGQTKDFTSARLNSKFAFTYGAVEVRAKLPAGNGTWPAIWTLGRNVNETGGYWADQFGTTGWPRCGEIDIMEHWGTYANEINCALHTPSSSGDTQNKAKVIGDDVSNTFHTYGMEWTFDQIKFYYDSTKYYTYSPTFRDSENWPFSAQQYLLLNIAMGGNFGGDDRGLIDTDFTQTEMVIDYVRVYQKQ